MTLKLFQINILVRFNCRNVNYDCRAFIYKSSYLKMGHQYIPTYLWTFPSICFTPDSQPRCINTSTTCGLVTLDPYVMSQAGFLLYSSIDYLRGLVSLTLSRYTYMKQTLSRYLYWVLWLNVQWGVTGWLRISVTRKKIAKCL